MLTKMKLLVIGVLGLLVCCHFVFWPSAFAGLRHDKTFSTIDIILSCINVILAIWVLFNTEDPIPGKKFVPWILFVVIQLIFVCYNLAEYKVDQASHITKNSSYIKKPNSHVLNINRHRSVFLRGA